MTRAWNLLVAASTVGGLLWFAWVAKRVPDAFLPEERPAAFVLLAVSGTVVVNWGLIASTFYDRLPAWKRVILVTLSIAPFLLYEAHAALDERKMLHTFRGGWLTAGEYLLTFVPPAICAAIILALRRGLPAALVTIAARLGFLGRSRPPEGPTENER